MFMPAKKTLEMLLQEFNHTHGETYDYSLITIEIYKDMHTPIPIICKVHGEFLQNPNNHKNGSKCPACSIIIRANKRRKTKEDFIYDSEIIHGKGKYDYTLFEYKNNKKPSKIKCLKHNIYFKKSPQNHIKERQGCPNCTHDNDKKQQMEKGLIEFLSTAKEIHGDRYDYSRVIYINSGIKVIIICSIHGEFEQRTGDHINKKCGCSKCGKIQMALKTTIGPDKFIIRAIEKHGEGIYDYSLVIGTWVNTHTYVTIICPIHGEFSQTPTNHLSTDGCNKCGIEKTAEKTRNNINKNIEKWKKNPNFEHLDFSKCIYINCATKMEINCIKDNHGLFKQSSGLLDRGFGCKKCHPNIDEEYIYNYLIVLKDTLKDTEWDIDKIYYKDIENKPFRNIYPLGIDFIILFKNGIIKGVEFDGPTHFDYKMYRNNSGYLIKYLKHWNRDIIKNYCILTKTIPNTFNKNIDSLLRIDYKSWKKYKYNDKNTLIKNFICSKNNGIIYSDHQFYKKISERNLYVLLAHYKFIKSIN